MLPRSDLVYKTSAWLLCQAGMKWRMPEVMLPIPRGGTICFRDSLGALIRFSFRLKRVSRHGAAPCSGSPMASLHYSLPPPRRFKRPLHRCNACDPKSGSQWTCSTSCGCSSVRFPTGGGALVRFNFQKVAAPDGFAPSTSRVRAGRSCC